MRASCLLIIGLVFITAPAAVQGGKKPPAAIVVPDVAVTTCEEGWVDLAKSCTSDQASDVCVKIAPPIKLVSWVHMQYQCDFLGGFLPETTDDNRAQIILMLQSYNLLYGETLMYLGARDITHNKIWNWVKNAGEVKDTDTNTNWADDTLPVTSNNKDCLSLNSATTKWVNVDCEDDNIQTQVAYICMKKKVEQKVKGSSGRK